MTASTENVTTSKWSPS